MNKKMKDSGVEWIGEIPEDWKIVQMRYLTNITTGNKDTVDAEIDGKYPFFVRSKKIRRINSYSYDGEGILTAGDGDIGEIFHYINEKIDFHQRVYLFYDFKGINGKLLFFNLMVNLKTHISFFNAKTTVDSLRLPWLKEFPIILPPLSQQKSIAAFLDEKTLEIDNIISKTKEAIKEYKDYKQSLITEIVTKGLYKNVPMKDSGIEWIGDIPEDWETRKLKYIFTIKKDIAKELGYDVLSITQKGFKVRDLSSNEGQLSMDYSKYQIVKKNDFGMNHMDLLTGWVDLSKTLGVTSPDYRVFNIKDKNDYNKYYYLKLLQLSYSNKIFYGSGQGVSNLGRWRLQTEAFNNISYPVPPLKEQEEIANHLDEKCSQIDKIISTKEKLLIEMGSYKKSLIYETVTGKREVV